MNTAAPSEATPVQESATAAAGTAVETGTAPQLEPSTSWLKVLLVEDNAINQRITLKQLGQLGYGATAAGNGQEALAAIAHTPYDVILMDCQMPVMDGYTATRLLREMERSLGATHHFTIIALTAGDSPEERHLARCAGMDDYLCKPVTKEILSHTLRFWQHTRSGAQPLPSPSTAEAIAPASLPLDRERLHQITDGSMEFAVDLLRLFMNDIRHRLPLLKGAIATQDTSNVAAIAHHIRGASANVGACLMQAAADQLEQKALSRRLEDTAQLVMDLETFLAQLGAIATTLDDSP